MKTWKDVAEAVRAGVTLTVEFKKPVEDQEGYLEAGMRGVLIACQDEDDTLISFTIDLSAHEAFNVAFEKSNYFDKHGAATLTARQAGYYPKDNRESVWTDGNDTPDGLVAFVDTGAANLYLEYLAAAQATSYVHWLEAQVRDHRARASA